jgi:ketosteroid isomerase-like protein
MTVDERQITDTCLAFADAMREMDYGRMEQLWDSGYDHLIYQPEEFEHPCRGWEEIVAYWNYIPGEVESIPEWRTLDSDIAVDGGAALVFTRVAVSLKLKGVEEPLSGDVRYSLGLRRTAGGWRLVHCHESRQLVVDGDGSS